MSNPMGKSGSKSKDARALFPRDARADNPVSFGAVSVMIIEVNKVVGYDNHTQFNIAYRITDDRQAPRFISELAHYFASENENLVPAFEKIVRHYEEVKSLLRIQP